LTSEKPDEVKYLREIGMAEYKKSRGRLIYDVSLNEKTDGKE
jgi:hypothetical protein